TDPTPEHDEADSEPIPVLRFYTRPGCVFSYALRRQLDKIPLPFDVIDIWDDPEAGAFVRSVARGHETVPTVAIGEHALVNPTPGEVVGLVAAVAPELLPEGMLTPRPSRLKRLFG
ncbi:MAG: glutaredoxin domain-containing protein, partial [Acidimicrobiales bacterium]